LRSTLSTNPFLEQEEVESDQEAPDADGSSDGEDVLHDNESDATTEDEPDHAMQSAGGVRDGAFDGAGRPEDTVAATTELRTLLRGQANLLPLSSRDQALIHAVIESLDDDGYLRQALLDIGALVPVHPAPDACEMGTALSLVQSFEPSGVGARSLAECLTLQLAGVAPAHRELTRRVVRDHLELVAKHDVAAIARKLGCAPAEAETACQAIRRLDPRPGWRYARPDTQYLAPDVIVRKSAGKWSVALNPAIVPKLRVNQHYADLFQRHRNSKHGELAAHLQEARWTVRNVEQRFSTILLVADAILRRQHRFLEYGALAMRPLGLREIADELGLHESTVCRVTNNKYMATPCGVFELKHFFSRAMPMDGGGTCTGTAIRGVMAELMAAEDPARPLSDVEITQRLSRQGLTVARRTVTKYRQLLKVPPVELRRRVAAQAGAA
jgi:RNA polymerase sigma-54 factor